jgi:hypothetical protein
VTPPLNCAKETLAEKATTRNAKKQRTAVVILIQIPHWHSEESGPLRKRIPHRPRLSADNRPSRDDRALHRESKCKQLHHFQRKRLLLVARNLHPFLKSCQAEIWMQ